MTFFSDLSECSYFEPRLRNLTAVGWLEVGHAYATGTAPDTFVSRLAELAVTAWQPFLFPGLHLCDMCEQPDASTVYKRHGRTIALGSTNIFVPHAARVFVSPTMILHYIDAHRYVPPQVFIDAVAACPPMGSADYLDALRSGGVIVR
jgi:hypothetical protein